MNAPDFPALISFDGPSKTSPLAPPITVFQIVFYAPEEALKIENGKLIGLSEIRVHKVMSLESPFLFKMCHENTMIPEVTITDSIESASLKLVLKNARICKAVLQGQALISKGGSEMIFLTCESASVHIETNSTATEALTFLQNYYDIRDPEEEREMREQILRNYRKNLSDP